MPDETTVAVADPDVDELPGRAPGLLSGDAAAVPAPGVAAEEQARDDAALPDPEAMERDGDFTVFMKKDVPDAVRRLALRRLWRLDPVLANVDGLVDYGDDFTDAARVIPGMKTAYKVGRGFLKELTEDGEAAKTGPAEPAVIAANDGPATDEPSNDAPDVPETEATDGPPDGEEDGTPGAGMVGSAARSKGEDAG
ncbi:hypothetical protein OCH7691_02663 [Oceanibacterium hippocampi]|uniref:DUF3306 domain-containing protein n=2 Tax=Oceanibacterium hippocampi TaxID=745714 RepID=A0A1Y5TBV2_9PROT|nr:hypothetical protein OCH7691_02663 [Oceanibacterium hippocampi]